MKADLKEIFKKHGFELSPDYTEEIDLQEITHIMEQYAELRIQQEREKWKEETKHNYWHKGHPSAEMSVICRMFSGYIKMCHWTGEEWLDMWSDKLEGDVVEWMFIPID